MMTKRSRIVIAYLVSAVFNVVFWLGFSHELRSHGQYMGVKPPVIAKMKPMMIGVFKPLPPVPPPPAQQQQSSNTPAKSGDSHSPSDLSAADTSDGLDQHSGNPAANSAHGALAKSEKQHNLAANPSGNAAPMMSSTHTAMPAPSESTAQSGSPDSRVSAAASDVRRAQQDSMAASAVAQATNPNAASFEQAKAEAAAAKQELMHAQSALSAAEQVASSSTSPSSSGPSSVSSSQTASMQSPAKPGTNTANKSKTLRLTSLQSTARSAEDTDVGSDQNGDDKDNAESKSIAQSQDNDKPISNLFLKQIQMWTPRPGQKFNLATNLNITFDKNIQVVAGPPLTEDQIEQIEEMMRHQHLLQVKMNRKDIENLADLRRQTTSKPKPPAPPPAKDARYREAKKQIPHPAAAHHDAAKPNVQTAHMASPRSPFIVSTWDTNMYRRWAARPGFESGTQNAAMNNGAPAGDQALASARSEGMGGAPQSDGTQQSNSNGDENDGSARNTGNGSATSHSGNSPRELSALPNGHHGNRLGERGGTAGGGAAGGNESASNHAGGTAAGGASGAQGGQNGGHRGENGGTAAHGAAGGNETASNHAGGTAAGGASGAQGGQNGSHRGENAGTAGGGAAGGNESASDHAGGTAASGASGAQGGQNGGHRGENGGTAAGGAAGGTESASNHANGIAAGGDSGAQGGQNEGHRGENGGTEAGGAANGEEAQDGGGQQPANGGAEGGGAGDGEEAASNHQGGTAAGGRTQAGSGRHSGNGGSVSESGGGGNEIASNHSAGNAAGGGAGGQGGQAGAGHRGSAGGTATGAGQGSGDGQSASTAGGALGSGQGSQPGTGLGGSHAGSGGQAAGEGAESASADDTGPLSMVEGDGGDGMGGSQSSDDQNTRDDGFYGTGETTEEADLPAPPIGGHTVPGALALPPSPPVGTAKGVDPVPHKVKMAVIPPPDTYSVSDQIYKVTWSSKAQTTMAENVNPRIATKVPVGRHDKTGLKPVLIALTIGSVSSRGEVPMTVMDRPHLPLGTPYDVIDPQEPPAKGLPLSRVTARMHTAVLAETERPAEQPMQKPAPMPSAAPVTNLIRFAHNSLGIKEGTEHPLPPTPMPDSNSLIGDGSGLKGDYYEGPRFDRFIFSRADAKVDFDWINYPTQSPGPGIIAYSDYTARWTGRIVAPYSETYTFFAAVDDGVRVWIDHKLVLDGWSAHSLTQFSSQFTFRAGEQYLFKCEYLEVDGGGASVYLYWQSPHTPKEFIPEDAFFYPLPSDEAALKQDVQPL